MDFIIHNLYLYINEFTNLQYLCDACKKYNIYKKYVLYIKLNKHNSLKYYYNNENFRDIVLSKIFNSYKQLSIDLSGSDIINIDIHNLHSLDLSYSKITDFSRLTNIYILNLTNCNISNVDNLSNSNTLILDRCNIVNVSKLGKVKKLSLAHCHNIVDVSELGNIDDLCLCNCHNLSDIKSLINNKKLDISRCHKIRDFSFLSNIHLSRLDISCCYITDINIFKNVDNLIANYIIKY